MGRRYLRRACQPLDDPIDGIPLPDRSQVDFDPGTADLDRVAGSIEFQDACDSSPFQSCLDLARFGDSSSLTAIAPDAIQRTRGRIKSSAGGLGILATLLKVCEDLGWLFE